MLEAGKNAQKPGVKKFKYLGEGRYELVLEEDLKQGPQSKILEVFTVTRDKAGVYTIAPPALTPKARKELKDVGIQMSGTAQMYLPKNVKVIDTNASDTPGFFNKAYDWKIGASQETPSIRFTLAP